MRTEDEYRNVFENVRYLRKLHGLSRTAMARKLRITVKTLDILETGVFPERIGIHFFFQVEQAFGISPVRLLTTCLETAENL